MSPLHNLEDAVAQRLVNDMNCQGYAVLEGAIDAEALQGLRGYVDAQAARHGQQYFAYHGYPALAGSALAQLASAAGFSATLARLHRGGSGKDAADTQVFPVLRCVQGGSGRKESNAFHYDATLITMLLPIHIPSEGQQRGDLVLFPNLRRVRPSVVLNVLEKALLQNKYSRRLLCAGIDRGWLKPTVLRIEPGNVYFFWGYRSLHANQPCSPEVRRATALFHYGDPHAGSLATRLMLKLNQHRARRAIARATDTA
ncbi:hypothetical protein [Pseudomonas typographi]|uniref:Phytanoyl-CoA dioxygenase n=1 Tax=Pseudomonas typographi TaxID=2715964 RepID=A0ABR7YVE3_9PSED|nr:hypothetical protein [Pseudomonas typographi]MBD1552148.1 hypothetical protein [Pseudomonas typographi]MBD1585120.1 hypothetical protein [Pseudomonas typographi]MBD1597167.1 hypothetical protein [Pseudomonas typographi]